MTPNLLEEETVTNALPEHTGVMSVIDETGDSEVKWNRRNSSEVDMAKAAFNSMKSKGYAAYKMNASGKKGEVITSFDPDAESIIFAPPMVGG